MVVQLRKRDTQSQLAKPTYAAVFIAPSAFKITEPASITVPKLNKQQVKDEGIVKRCTESNCPYRGAQHEEQCCGEDKDITQLMEQMADDMQEGDCEGEEAGEADELANLKNCLLYTSPSPRDS